MIVMFAFINLQMVKYLTIMEERYAGKNQIRNIQDGVQEIRKEWRRMKKTAFVLGIVVGFISAFVGIIYEQPFLLLSATISFFSCASLLD